MPARWEVSDKIALLRQHDNGVPWTRLAAESGVSLRTLSRWARAYRADSTSHGLARRQRSDHGRRRIPTELIEIVEALALAKPAPTVAFVHRRVAGIAHDRGLSAPSYSSVRSLVTGIDPGLRALAEHGDAGYRDRFELVLRRSAERPNEQWQVDHTLLDVAILGAKGTQVRPWLTVVLDDYSRAVAGYTLFLGAPSAEQTALALHQAVNAKTNPGWPVCGLPEVLYSDHGSDFTSARLEQVCLDTHIRLIHSRVGVPQGRGKIERFYRTVTTELLPHLPGYIPHGTNGAPVTTPALTLEDLDVIVEQYVVAEYNTRPHSQTHQGPNDRWSASGFIPRSPAHPEDLDLLLLTAATTRKVQRDGIQFASTRYLSTVLAAYVGEQVTVRFNPRDVGEIRVYFNDEFLCRAIAPELSAESISLDQLKPPAANAAATSSTSSANTAPSPAPSPATPATPHQQAAPTTQHRHRLLSPDHDMDCVCMPPTNKLSVLGKDDDGRRFLTGTFDEVNSPAPHPHPAPAFHSTREHRRFTEFADTVRTHRYIGLCWGPPGIGKTLSARHYAGVDDWEQWQSVVADAVGPVPPRVLEARTAFYTPTVAATVKQIDQGLPRACQAISYAIDYAELGLVDPYLYDASRSSGRTELLIIDEADRLKSAGLEQVRDYYDRHHMGVILIGMPGIEKRLARYPQLYSRIGFAHEYRPLGPDELTAVLSARLPAQHNTDHDPIAHAAALATIARITAGNFRLLDRLITQIERVQTINDLYTLSPELVDAAREALLIGH